MDCVTDFTSREVRKNEVRSASLEFSYKNLPNLIQIIDFSTFSGSVCVELHGKIFEDEPKDITTIPRIPNVSQWKCNGHGTKVRKDVNNFVVYTQTQPLFRKFI